MNGEEAEGPPAAPEETRDPPEVRRQKVYRLVFAQGFTEVQAAGLLRVHRNTISSDVKWLKEQNRERVATIDAFEEIGDHDRFLREIEVLALSEFNLLRDEYVTVEVTDPQGRKTQERRVSKSHAVHRGKMLELAKNARESRMRYQLETGVVPKAPEKLDLSVFNVNGVDVRKLTPESARVLRDQLLAQMLAEGVRVPAGLLTQEPPPVSTCAVCAPNPCTCAVP